MHDVVVLGAGIVGVSCAFHSLKRGLTTVLVDKRGPGEETSFGNTGVIDGGNILPLAMPRDPFKLARFALNRSTAIHYHPTALPKVAPFLWRYHQASTPEQNEETARVMRPLFAIAVESHREMARAARAERFFRDTGWLKLFRSKAALDAQSGELALAASYQTRAERLTGNDLMSLEPALKPGLAGAIWARDADTVSSPGGVTKAYAQTFVAQGGLFLKGDALTLAASAHGYRVETEEGVIHARNAVVALGPWSPDLVGRFSYRFPLGVKRGYHQHFRPVGASLTRPVVDEEVGYCLTPMEAGIRLTTGAEFADRDAPKTPVQIGRARRHATALVDLGEPVEAEPWMGRRPMTPDSRPVLGPSPRHPGLWFAFGHGHWGFTLGPATGRLIAAAIAGEDRSSDLAPYRPGRFG